jgi:hypothetical protein
MVTAQQKHLPEEGSLGPTIRLETGLYIPLGEFEKAISPSPSLSIIGGIKLNEKWRIDPGLTLFLPQSNNKVLIVSQKSTVTGRINTLSGHLGASINRVEKLGSRIFMEARAGTGFSFLQTDKEKENVPDDSNDNFYGSETIFLNAGLGFKIFAFKQSYIGLEFNYYFTPYNLFGQRFVDSIGNQAISIGVSYGL